MSEHDRTKVGRSHNSDRRTILNHFDKHLFGLHVINVGLSLLSDGHETVSLKELCHDILSRFLRLAKLLSM